MWKELADEQVEWQRKIMPRKIQLQKVQPIRDGKALWMMGKIRYYKKHMSKQKSIATLSIKKMENNELSFVKVTGFRVYDGTRYLVLFGLDVLWYHLQ